jgi:hypothetical protein
MRTVDGDAREPFAAIATVKRALNLEYTRVVRTPAMEVIEPMDDINIHMRSDE